ncbi:ATP-dependent helicase/deoxyribonuclease subunit B [Planctomycetes bacterium CA13]|uniref:ATP-dependent helicase/deoxyribonuclease subunit B n=1 Tax=Novipirellula herctigrandis TaxID=2527986 RepID=A0A5C5ZAF0_9BACT|nr:ATP-dependent helicase/deoxyribonuclease subunit B [Planctomycetes bacterium CA13]
MNSLFPSSDPEFLGWDKPLIPLVADILARRFASGEALNLSRFLCVLPTSFGSHRFELLLGDRADEAGLSLCPPQILTLGQLPEQLYRPRKPLAIEFEQTLAWSRVLASAHPDELAPLVPTLPHSDEVDSWMELAATIRGLHEELASNQLSFLSVAEVSEAESDKRRWKLLAKLFDGFLTALDQAGLADPHHERQYALQNHACNTDKTIVLIGTSDLSQLQTAMLDAVQAEIMPFVAAPTNQTHRFDQFGCIVTEKWTNYVLPVEDNQLIPAGDIADQASAVAESLAELATDFPADEITIGVTDESQVGPIELELRGCGVDTFRHLGWTVSRTAVGRLIELAAAYLKSHSWQSLATLVRHSDVHDWITKTLAQRKHPAKSIGSAKSKDAQVDWLIELDQLLANHYPIQIDADLPKEAKDNYPQAIAVATLVEKWLTPFSNKKTTRPLARWCETISKWLASLFDEGENDDDHSFPLEVARTTMALQSVLRLLKRFSEVNANLDFEIDGATAMQMIANRTGELRVVQPMECDDVEILGWLDLALDDAEALLVVGLNHPFVPAAVTSDAFLPGNLRTQLRMADNDRRYARDVYNMQLLLSARKSVRFIIGRNSADGSPTPPSRLLAAASDIDIARRIRSLLEVPRPRIIVEHRWDITNESAALPIPALPPSSGECPVKAMSVTAFRDYLACPYRFYLRHVLKLKPLDDVSSELAANQFGDLIHGALERFGESDDRDESDQKNIYKLLLQNLHAYADDHYGYAASTAVALQIRQAERRLSIVAREQSKRMAEGWFIKQSEASVDDKKMGACIEVDGFKMGLRGRLDRIDFHPGSGKWAILDYKTHGHKPEKKHLKKTENGPEWIDLQLPLYRMMIPYLGIEADVKDVQLGYFNISDKDAETKINIAVFDEALMDQAQQLIYDCVRRIRDGDFQPSDKPIQYDDYDMILQTGTM